MKASYYEEEAGLVKSVTGLCHWQNQPGQLLECYPRLSVVLILSWLIFSQLHQSALEQKPNKHKGLYSRNRLTMSTVSFSERVSVVCGSTCASMCLPWSVSLKINRRARVCGSQTVLHLYWNSKLPTVLPASAQHWPLRALICSHMLLPDSLRNTYSILESQSFYIHWCNYL